MSYEQFKVFWIMVKNWKSMVDYHMRNGSKNYLTKKASQFRGNLVLFSKECNKNEMISGEKHEKYLKCKSDVKKLLRAFNQELWANSGFLKSGQKSIPYLTRSLRGPANDLHARSRGDRVLWMSCKVKKDLKMHLRLFSQDLWAI